MPEADDTTESSEMNLYDDTQVSSETMNVRLRQITRKEESAFSAPWLPSNRRAVTYMLYKQLTEEYLRKTLLRLRASDAAIEKAVKDLRKLKGLDLEPEVVLMEGGDNLLVIHGRGLFPYTFIPLHRCNAQTSVCVKKNVISEGIPEEKTIGDVISGVSDVRVGVEEVVDDGSVGSSTMNLSMLVQKSEDGISCSSSVESWDMPSKDDVINEVTAKPFKAKGPKEPKVRRSSFSRLPNIVGSLQKIFRRRSALN